MPHLRDALIDAVDAKASAVEGLAAGTSEHLTSRVESVVLVAARKGATLADLRGIIERTGLVRLDLVARWLMLGNARALVGHHVDRIEALVARVGRGQRGAVIRKRDVEERRARRTDRIEDVPADEPPLESLRGKSEAEIRALLERHGVALDEDRMLAAELERVSRRLIGADRPSDALVADVIKQAEGAVRRLYVVAAKDAVRTATTARLTRGRPADARYLDVAVMDDNTCDDCEEWHNESMTMAEWERVGKPGSQNRRCWMGCRCELLPDDLYEPALREGPGGISAELTFTQER